MFINRENNRSQKKQKTPAEAFTPPAYRRRKHNYGNIVHCVILIFIEALGSFAMESVKIYRFKKCGVGWGCIKTALSFFVNCAIEYFKRVQFQLKTRASLLLLVRIFP